MANLPVHHMPFAFNMNPSPFEYQANYLNNVYGHQFPRQHQPLDMQTMGLISALAPHLRQLDVQGKPRDDLAHVPAKGRVDDKEHDFHIHLDVGLFSPDELSVKIVEDHLIIEGKHEERKANDVGFVSRHFVRRYELPKDFDPNNIVSKLSSDGVLSVLLPKPTDRPKERIIAIQVGGPNDVFLKKKAIKEDKTKTNNGIDQAKKG